jgi:hypothetical protein
MNIDFCIIEAEFQVEPKDNPYGHFILLRFVDFTPTRPKLLNIIRDLKRNQDVDLIDYTYTESPITAKTNLKGLEITLN